MPDESAAGPTAEAQSVPFAFYGFFVGRGPPVLAMAVSPAPPRRMAGPLWELLAAHGMPDGPAAVAAIAQRLPALSARSQRRLGRFFAAVDTDAIPAGLGRKARAVLEAAFPGTGLADAVFRILPAHQDRAWERLSLHPDFLALAGAPPETFCLMPDAAGLPILAERWGGPMDCAPAVQEAVLGAMDLAEQGRPWLNRWTDDRPVGLWHWCWRKSEDITPFNGGNVFTRYVWAVFAAAGAVPAVRFSRSAMVGTPPGLWLAQPQCPFRYAIQPWTPAGEHDLSLLGGLDLTDPHHPRPRTPSP